MDWNIQARSRYCTGCQRKFVDKQPYQTTLFDRGADGFLREDLCMECKDRLPATEEWKSKGTFVSQWHGIFQVPQPVVQNGVVQRNTVEHLLRKIVELNDDSYKSAAYVLAAMLERKRILKIKSVHKNANGKVTIYEHAGTGDIFAIEDPGLHVYQLEEVQRSVCTLLEQGLPPEAEEALSVRRGHPVMRPAEPEPSAEGNTPTLFESAAQQQSAAQPTQPTQSEQKETSQDGTE